MKNNSLLPKSAGEWAALLALLLLYGVVAAAHAGLAPLTTGPDELAHFEYVSFVAERGHLPLTSDERAEASYKSDQPPLYHLLAALPAALVETDAPSPLKRYSDHPRRQLIEQTRHAWGLYNTLDEQWPWRGEVLRWHVGRWLSILFGLLTVLATYLLARWFFAGRWPLALASAAVVGFIPRFALTGSMLNYETLLAFIATLFLAALLKIASQQVSRSAGQQSNQASPNSRFTLHSSSFILFLIGLLAGLAIVTKLSALILPLEILLAFWLIGRYCRLSWRTWSRWLLSAALGTLLPVGAWYGFVLANFNTVAQDGWWVGLLRPLIAADASDATTNRLLSWLTGGQAGFTGAIENLEAGPPWEWAAIFFRTFWVVGIEGQQPGGTPALVIAGALVAVAAAGLVALWAGAFELRITNYELRITNDELPITRLFISLLFVHLLLPLLLPLIRYAATFSLADTAQGRHVLFMAAPAFALLLIWGITAATWQVQQGYQNKFVHYALHLTPFIPGLFLFGWSLTQLQTMTWAYLPPLPVTTQPGRVPPLEQRPEAALSPYITLLGYETQRDAQQRTLRVDLWWRAEAVSPVDYLWQMALIDADRRVWAEWQGHPAAGRYPTRAWDPGDIIHDTIWLPLGGLRAGDYELVLHPRPTATRYPVEAEAEPVSLGAVTLPDSTLQIFEEVFPLPAFGAVAGYTVWHKGQPLETVQPYRYRETMSVSLPNLPDNLSRELRLVLDTPADEPPLAFDPLLLSTTQALFMVGPEWPSGDYRLQLFISDRESRREVVNSPVVAQVVNRRPRDFAAPSPAQPVYANFANRVELLGYDLAATRAEPGGAVPLTLYWRGLDWLGEDLTIFTKLLRVDDQSRHGGRDRLPQEGYRTLYWAPGEVVVDPFGLPVDADAPDGIYFINVGLYQEVEGQAVSLPLVQDEQVTEITSLNLGPVKIGPTPPEFVQESATPQVAVNQPFGDAPTLTLLGYDLAVSGQPSVISQPTTQPTNQTDGDSSDSTNPTNSINSSNSTNSINLKLYWQVEAPPALNYTTFVHLRNAAGETIAQKDQPPLAGAYPTSLWEPGEIIADEISVPLPPDLPPDDYALVIGLYDFNTFQRLPVPEKPANEITLTRWEAAAVE